MDSRDTRVSALFEKYLSNSLTAEERVEFLDYVDDPAYAREIDALISDAFENQTDVPGLSAEGRTRVLDQIFNQGGSEMKKPKVISLWPRIAAAASIILCLSFGGYFLLHKKQAVSQLAQNQRHDIAPGHNQATLTLANGKKIILTKGLSGMLAKQGNTRINASQNNITYDATTPGDQLVYNTLSTARGEQSPYPLVLADGTKVWLNAESSIIFPTAFNGKERIVKLTGEAYFEVKHNAKQPFKVQTATQTIEDIGTQFDVNAYSDEPQQNTTLVEGGVKVNSLILKPGQQSDGRQIKSVNTSMITAWKNGRFHFEGDDIETVMRQLARWYNIDVAYQGRPTKEIFYAGINRDRNISAVLQLLENTKGVRFKIEGRRVTVIE